MAQRFWVGGAGNWDATTTHWSATSGGGSGASSPTAADDAIFNSLSGGGAVSVGTRSCLTFNATGFTGTFSLAASVLTIGGNMTLNNSVFGLGINSQINLNASATITSNGGTWPCIALIAASATITLGDDFKNDGQGGNKGFQFASTGQTFNANNKNVQMRDIFGATNTPAITMGSGTWVMTGDDGNCFDGAVGAWNMGSSAVTGGTSTLKFTSTTANDLTFNGGSQTFGSLWFARGSNTNQIICKTDSCTFTDIKDTGTAAHSLLFGNGSVTTFSTFHVTGSAGNLITISTFGSTNQHHLVCTTGIISCDYLVLSHSDAHGGATFYAGANSTNNQAVATAGSGWIFTAPPGAVNSGFFNFM